MFNKIVAMPIFCEPHIRLKIDKIELGEFYKVAICLPRGRVINIVKGAWLENEGDEEFFKALVHNCEQKCHKRLAGSSKKKVEKVKQFVIIGAFQLTTNAGPRHIKKDAVLEPPLYRKRFGRYDYAHFRSTVIKSARVLASFFRKMGVSYNGVRFLVTGFHALDKKHTMKKVSDWIALLQQELHGASDLQAFLNLPPNKNTAEH